MPTLTIINSPIQTGGNLVYRFSGFAPHAPVLVYVQGGGHVTNYADDQGKGHYTFPVGEPPGTYTLVAEEYGDPDNPFLSGIPAGSQTGFFPVIPVSWGNRATANFTVAEPDGNGNGDWIPDIPKPLAIGIVVALIAAIIFIPSKKPPGRYSR